FPKEAKDVWRAAPCRGPLTVTARIYAFDLSVRTAYVDTTRAYFNGASVFLCPEGYEAAPCTLEIALPAGDDFRAWRIATTMASAGTPSDRLAYFRAASYDELIDHPVEIADFARCSFTAGGAPHDVAITGRHEADLDRLTR